MFELYLWRHQIYHAWLTTYITSKYPFKDSQEINVSMQGGMNKTLMSQQFCNMIASVASLPTLIPNMTLQNNTCIHVPLMSLFV